MAGPRFLDPLKPYARAIKYAHLFARARRLARQADRGRGTDAAAMPVAFFFGCGRSGTTILGRIFEARPDVCYLYEPYHAWTAIDPRTDFIHLYVHTDAQCILRAEDADDRIRRRFENVLRAEAVRRGRAILIDKTPIHGMRLGYLDSLAPGARYVHIVRDGVDICRSIAERSTDRSYRIAGKTERDPWWGRRGVKWTFLARDGAAAGHYPDEVGAIEGYAERGAYEWLVTLREIDAHREPLGDRLHEVTYEDLTARPQDTLRSLARFLGLADEPAWLESSAARLSPARRRAGAALCLPPAMARDFNAYQERFGFAGRATPA